MAVRRRREVRRRRAAGRTSKAAFAAAAKEYVGSVVSKRKLIFSFAKLELSVTMLAICFQC